MYINIPYMGPGGTGPRTGWVGAAADEAGRQVVGSLDMFIDAFLKVRNKDTVSYAT